MIHNTCATCHGFFRILVSFDSAFSSKEGIPLHATHFQAMQPWFNCIYTPNANMADHSVCPRNELHESEASEASVFCFDNASPEKSCFLDGLVCFI